jgi:hypothetical protein
MVKRINWYIKICVPCQCQLLPPALLLNELFAFIVAMFLLLCNHCVNMCHA